ncbi:hypothetical protein Poli38472_007230 [Pythium oligandrum]|uniref:Protein kinase domain-containing protein n=1 Tax=Pythium oligandrum TaxID=41045 RepID=A0A8K1FD58_PYTOL|nr:hypothetical protein Poli38472_007230 [Pythium oligandrum]|eukprot:TMW59085.1 hypothetical protein Poli38472_007230 [Pythium oligandrum]
MRGKEKNAMNKQSEAFSELTSKMTGWNPLLYGNLPYILGYATSAAAFRLVAIEEGNGQCRATTILELDILQHTAEALKVFYNLGMLYHKMATLSHLACACDLRPFLADVRGKRTLVLLDKVIERTIKRSDCEDTNDFERLIRIYRKLEGLKNVKSDVTHLQTVELLEVKWDKQLVVELSPIGYVRHPKDNEVSQWLEHMLTALKHWHALGYCHGDLRWGNMVCVPGHRSEYWVLIDMDESREPDTKVIDWNHTFRGDTLRFQHDLYQLGKLLSGFSILSDNLKDLHAMLLTAVDTPNMTAEIALAKLLE